MVNTEDANKLMQKAQEFKKSIQKMEELHQKAQNNSNLTVDKAAYTDLQEEAKKIIAELTNRSNEVAGRTDKLEDSQGNLTQDLPNPAVTKDKSTNIPSNP